MSRSSGPCSRTVSFSPPPPSSAPPTRGQGKETRRTKHADQRRSGAAETSYVTAASDAPGERLVLPERSGTQTLRSAGCWSETPRP